MAWMLRNVIFPLNVPLSPKRHYRYRGITASYLPSPRYYREIFPIPAVPTVALPLFPLPRHPLVSISRGPTHAGSRGWGVSHTTRGQRGWAETVENARVITIVPWWDRSRDRCQYRGATSTFSSVVLCPSLRSGRGYCFLHLIPPLPLTLILHSPNFPSLTRRQAAPWNHIDIHTILIYIPATRKKLSHLSEP